jgi:type IV secretory pathway VirJ component
MNRFLVFTVLAIIAISGISSAEKLYYQPFDSLTLYMPPTGKPSQVVLFISGDGGWNLGVKAMAQKLSDLGALAVGINITKYLKHLNSLNEKCHYPAGDFELLSKFVQKKLDFPTYITPMLIGYSSGATLVYALLVEAPPGTFKGAISMGFCPDLPLVNPLCSGYGLKQVPDPKGHGVLFLPSKELASPWIAFQGTIDQVCSPDSVQAFVEQTSNAKVMELPKVGHGFSVEKNWLPQFKAAYLEIIEHHEASLSKPSSTAIVAIGDLPVVEVRAPDSIARNQLAIILTGDGGWAGIDKSLAGALAQVGVDVVGWNSLQYYWKKRTPQEAATDLGRIINHYKTEWKKEHVAIIGYSYGADVIPFLVNRLDSATRVTINNVSFLGLSPMADFQFHVMSFVGGVTKEALPTLPEIAKIKGIPMLYFYGSDEKETVVDEIDRSKVRLIELKGGHHLGGNYEAIADSIMTAIGK